MTKSNGPELIQNAALFHKFHKRTKIYQTNNYVNTKVKYLPYLKVVCQFQQAVCLIQIFKLDGENSNFKFVLVSHGTSLIIEEMLVVYILLHTTNQP